MEKDMNNENRKPDVIAIIQFNGIRKGNAKSGYRPGHLVNNDYITTGVHYYFDLDEVPPNSTAKGTITFLTPELYPNCLWIGKQLQIFEGKNIVGYATILKILNPILEKK